MFDLSGAEGVVVIRRGGLGDVLQITPLVRTLAMRGLKVDVVTARRHRCLFDANLWVRQVVRCSPSEFEFDPGRWDVAVDLQACNELETYPVHQARAFGMLCGVEISDVRLDYALRAAEIAGAREMLASRKDAKAPRGREEERSEAPLVGYVWEAAGGNRSWTEEAHRAHLAALMAAGYRVVILAADEVGSELPEDEALINLSGQTSIREAAAVLSVCDVAVSPDTGLFHLAQAVGTPVVGYFGAFPMEERDAGGPATLVNDPGQCGHAPCRQHSCAFLDASGNVPCLATEPEVLAVAVRALVGN